MSYHPTVEQAARVGTMLALLDDPRELARIAGIGSKEGGLNRADLPSRKYIMSRTLYVRPGVGGVSKYMDKMRGKRELKQEKRCFCARLTEAECMEINRLAALGWLTQPIADAIGVSRQAIVYYASTHGVTIRKLSRGECAKMGAKAAKERCTKRAA